MRIRADPCPVLLSRVANPDRVDQLHPDPIPTFLKEEKNPDLTSDG